MGVQADTYYSLKVAASVIVYCLSVSAVPIYNKEIFQGRIGGVKKYPYPIAMAFLQLGSISATLGVVNVLFYLMRACETEPKSPLPTRERSWLLGPHFRYKVRHVAPVGCLFGLKYGITNWGLQLMPTGSHLLLQSTDLIWTVVAARVLNKEHLGVIEYCSAMLGTIGSVMIGLHMGQTLDAPAIPLLINCLTPCVLALCISTLRSGARELFRPDNVLGGSVTAIEFTALKLALSASVALALSMCLENGRFGGREAWWVALQNAPPSGMAVLLLGGVFVLIFQVNLTWLTGLTSAVTVGIVGGLKVVPQWLLNAAFQLHVDLAPLSIAGAGLVLASSILYAWAISSPHELILSSEGFEWKFRLTQQNGAEALAEKLVAVEDTTFSRESEELWERQRSGAMTSGSFLDVVALSDMSPCASQTHGPLRN